MSNSFNAPLNPPFSRAVAPHPSSSSGTEGGIIQMAWSIYRTGLISVGHCSMSILAGAFLFLPFPHRDRQATHRNLGTIPHLPRIHWAKRKRCKTYQVCTRWAGGSLGHVLGTTTSILTGLDSYKPTTFVLKSKKIFCNARYKEKMQQKFGMRMRPNSNAILKSPLCFTSTGDPMLLLL